MYVGGWVLTGWFTREGVQTDPYVLQGVKSLIKRLLVGPSCRPTASTSSHPPVVPFVPTNTVKLPKSLSLLNDQPWERLSYLEDMTPGKS